MLWHIQLNVYTQKIKFISHNKHLFGRHISIKENNTHRDQSNFKFFYSIWIKTIHKPSKEAAAIFFSLVCMFSMQLASMNVFYSMW